MAGTEKIVDCPFCGSVEVEICRTNQQACCVTCFRCGANAETAPTRLQAIANWNRRQSLLQTANIVSDDDAEWQEEEA